MLSSRTAPPCYTPQDCIASFGRPGHMATAWLFGRTTTASLSLHRRPHPTTAPMPAVQQPQPLVGDGNGISGAGAESIGGGGLRSMTWIVVAAMCVTAVALVYWNPIGAGASSSSSSLASAATASTDDPCHDQWTDEQLVGKCFGLAPFAAATSAEACRRHCCDQGAACITWQHQAGAGGRGCMVGGPVRLGLELAATSNWCEPSAPSPWRGHRVAGRGKDGQCTWGEALPFQCFGLGVERVREGAGAAEGGRLTEEECRARCCGETECGVWQWREDKGCFTAKKEGHCETGETELPYVGGRKRQDAIEA